MYKQKPYKVIQVSEVFKSFKSFKSPSTIESNSCKSLKPILCCFCCGRPCLPSWESIRMSELRKHSRLGGLAPQDMKLISKIVSKNASSSKPFLSNLSILQASIPKCDQTLYRGSPQTLLLSAVRQQNLKSLMREFACLTIKPINSIKLLQVSVPIPIVHQQISTNMHLQSTVYTLHSFEMFRSSI